MIKYDYVLQNYDNNFVAFSPIGHIFVAKAQICQCAKNLAVWI
jgi:hypothetical protein